MVRCGEVRGGGVGYGCVRVVCVKSDNMLNAGMKLAGLSRVITVGGVGKQLWHRPFHVF